MDGLAFALEKLESLLREIKEGDEAGNSDNWMFAWTFETNMETIQSFKEIYLDGGVLDEFMSLVGAAFVCGQAECDAALLNIRSDPRCSGAMLSLTEMFYSFVGFKDRRINSAITKTLKKAEAEIAEKLKVVVHQLEEQYECDLGFSQLAKTGKLCCLRDLICAFENLDTAKVESIRERIRFDAEIKKTRTAGKKDSRL